MIPLSMMRAGEVKKILKITGKDETRRFLEKLGFIENSEIFVVSEIAGNMIVNVKDTRIAIDKSMAKRVMTY